jgi:hypothetical protein
VLLTSIVDFVNRQRGVQPPVGCLVADVGRSGHAVFDPFLPMVAVARTTIFE